MVFSFSLIHGLKFGFELVEDANDFPYLFIDIGFIRFCWDIKNTQRP